MRFAIHQRDTIKARLVLSTLPAVDDRVRRMALLDLNRADEAFVIPVLVHLIAECRERVPAHPAIQALRNAKARLGAMGEKVVRCLIDNLGHDVRSAAYEALVRLPVGKGALTLRYVQSGS